MMRFFICMAAAIAVAPVQAQTQPYPNKPVRIMVGFAPGGIADEMGRYFGDFLARETGSQGIVENRVGAAGIPALTAVAKADPDGYTVGIAISGSLVMTPFVQKQMPIDTMKDLALVSALVETPNFIAISSKVPANTIGEFIALARSKPGGFEFGSAGMGSLPHLSAALFANEAKIELVHVPFRGNAPAIAEMMAGRVTMVASSIADLMPGVEAGQLRILLAAAPKRQSFMPDVPSAPEAGLPRYIVSTWVGLVAPPTTPQPILDRLHALSQRMMDDPQIQKRLQTRHIQPMRMSRAEFSAFVNKEYEDWRGYTQTMGIVPQ